MATKKTSKGYGASFARDMANDPNMGMNPRTSGKKSSKGKSAKASKGK